MYVKVLARMTDQARRRAHANLESSRNAKISWRV